MAKTQHLDVSLVHVAPTGGAVTYMGRPAGRVSDTGRRWGERGAEVIWQDQAGNIYYSIRAAAVGAATAAMEIKK